MSHQFEWERRCSIGWRLRWQIVVLCKRGSKFQGHFCSFHTSHAGLFNQNATWLRDHLQRHYLYEQLELSLFIDWLQSYLTIGFLSAFVIRMVPAGTLHLHPHAAVFNEYFFLVKLLYFSSWCWFHDCKVKTTTILPSWGKINAL